MASPGQRGRFTRQQWATIVIIGSVHFASAICISLQAPFYPREAESKGGTATEYGLVFGVFELTAFLSSPLFGKYLLVTGVKRTLNVGIVIAAVCSILFGLLDNFKSHGWFIGLSFVVRIIESLGASAALTAAFAITAAVFPDCVATIFATLEVFYGVGYIAGPTIGGLLFVAGGYILPFIVMGSLLLLVGVLIFFLLPANVGQVPEQNNSATHKKPGVISILKVPSVFVDSMCIVAASSSMGFYAALLEPHLRQFNLTEMWTSVMFVLSGAMYAVTAPFIGQLCDKGISPRLLTMVGCIAIFIGCLLVGPAPFFGVTANLYLVIAGLIIHGVGISLMLVSCFIDAIKSSVASGFNNDLSTYGLISGLWASSFSLGAFVGPSLAGVLFDAYGFQNATYYVLGTQIVVFIVMVIFMLISRRRRTKYQVVMNLTDYASDENNSLLLLNAENPKHKPLLEASEWDQPRSYGAVTTLPLRSIEVYG